MTGCTNWGIELRIAGLTCAHDLEPDSFAILTPLEHLGGLLGR